MKDGDGRRYSKVDEIVSTMYLANALEGGGDIGRGVPHSDAEDFGRGARFIPNEVTLARRKGLRVAFITSCKSSKCCWYWEFLDSWTFVYGVKGEHQRVYLPGTRTYHSDPDDAGWIRHESKGEPPQCPMCANTVIGGGTYDPSGKRMEYA
jgi:hypothetical protein